MKTQFRLDHLKSSRSQNVFWLFTEKIGKIIFTLLFTILVPNYLGAEKFGLLSLAISYFVIISNPYKLGITNILFRELIKRTRLEKRLLSSSFVIHVYSCLFFLFLFSAVVFFIGSSKEFVSVAVIIGLSLLFQPFRVLEFYFQAIEKSVYFSISSNVSFVLTLIFILLVVYFDLGLFWLSFYKVLESIVAAVVLFTIYKTKFLRGFSFLDFRPHKKVSFYLVKEGFPLFLHSALIVVQLKIDQVIIGATLGEEMNGFYALSAKWGEIYYFIPTIVSVAFFPAIVKSYKRSLREYQLKIRKLYFLNIFIAIFFIVMFYAFSRLFILTLYGPEYSLSITPLIILSTAGLFISIGVISSRWLINEGLQKYLLLGGLIATFFNILANILIVEEYGIIGVSVVSVVSYSIGSCFFLLFFKESRKRLLTILGLLSFVENNNRPTMK